MKFVSLLIAFCFTFNVMAASGTVAELEKALDNYHYALSVEWDQEDAAFHQAQTKALYETVQKLIKEGLSQEEIMTLAEKKMNNKAAFEALKLKLTLTGKINSAEELSKIIRESSKDLYSQGASWNGSVIIPVTALLVVGAVIGYAIWWHANHECVAYEEQYVCQTYNDCHYYGTGYYGGYYDPYYGGGYYCYSAPYTTCGWTNVCTKFQKK